MPTVPGSKQNVVPLGAQPSEADMLMALGEMRSIGRFASNPQSFDERFKGSGLALNQRLDPSQMGQIEDRRNMSARELMAAENQTRKDRMLGYPNPEADMKSVFPPSSLGRLAPAMAKRFGIERDPESIGVSGGSR